MKFSIIVPVYNAEKFLWKCLGSISSQSYNNFEVILINDGSTDSSGNICDEVVKKDARFQVIHKSNEGVSSARNNGINIASGDYIIFVDSDDWINEDALEKINNILKKYQYDICMFGIVREETNGSKIMFKNINLYNIKSKMEIVKILPELIKSERINAPFKVYSLKILNENNIKFDIRTSIGEDYLFNMSCFLKATSLYIFSDALYHYRTSSGTSLSTKFSSDKYVNRMYVNENILNTLVNIEEPHKVYEAVMQIRMKNVYSCFMDVFKKGCVYSFSEKLNFIETILEIEHLENYSSIKSKKFKILSLILKINSKFLVYIVSKTMFSIKKKRMLIV